MTNTKEYYRKPKARPTHCKRGHEFTPDNIYVQKRKDNQREDMWSCLKCRQDYAKQKWSNYTPEQKRDAMDKRTAVKYGLSVEEYREIISRGLCDICGRPEPVKNKSLAIDHCHATGKNRGLLCSGCNRGIGLLQDDTEVLQKAIDYLNNSRKAE